MLVESFKLKYVALLLGISDCRAIYLQFRISKTDGLIRLTISILKRPKASESTIVDQHFAID